MKRKRTKTHLVGLRVTEEQRAVLSKLQSESNLSKTDILLRGLEIISEYYSLGLDRDPLSYELRNLEKEAMRHTEALKQIRKREESIREMVQELRNVDEIIDKYQCDKSALIQILLEIQDKKHWLPKHALMWISERLKVPMIQILHIASFYKAFSLEPRGEHLVRVCLGTACHVRGGQRVLEVAERVLGIKAGETTHDLKFTLESVNCLGCCALGPVIVVDDEYHGKVAPSKAGDILASYTR
ncbi:MAG: NAD(P)H-dependent oxidoreductase subunit E [Thermodesulfovibrionales bacterium]|nr:NAD(P)H-dependent oxidoreductase subunit E [Thermodesulfovibrionales bacterium]